jgi:hypothetical protein
VVKQQIGVSHACLVLTLGHVPAVADRCEERIGLGHIGDEHDGIMWYLIWLEITHTWYLGYDARPKGIARIQHAWMWAMPVMPDELSIDSIQQIVGILL